MERPSGPIGEATMSQSNGKPAEPAASSRSASSNGFRKPANSLRQEPSNVSASAQPPATTKQIIDTAREAMEIAIQENQTKAAEASGVSTELTPGVTLDLSHKNIQKEFPEEVVDIIKFELERLALSHNQISTFPARFSECTALRYLNVRNNVIRDFPQAICALSQLEILDLGRNKLRILPPELSRLTSLKVLSVQKNRIEDLPLCIADMKSLQVLKLDGNPIRFPPKEVMQPQALSPPNQGFLKDSEINDVTITNQIKAFLKQEKISQTRSEAESGGEESSEGAETPRPLRRVMSGRFPIKVNGTDVPDLRSPALPRAPPIPSRSHQRGLSAQNAALRRPGLQPLSAGAASERLRSNSESLLQATRGQGERLDRSRRMGITYKKPSERGPLDDVKSNRYSHLRGLSHGSALHGNGMHSSIGSSRSPASPADNGRPGYIRRLSSLPERKRQSSKPDPIVESAVGILRSLDQIHYMIQSLVGLSREEGTSKRNSLERVFYNATTQVEELDRGIVAYNSYSEEDEEVAPLSNEIVHRACLACVQAYIHVCAQLTRNLDTLLRNGEPWYIRALLLSIYGSLAEVRNAGSSLLESAPTSMVSPRLPTLIENTIRPSPRDKSITPTRERPGLGSRARSATVVQHSAGLRVATDAARAPYLRSNGRSATMTSATPRSGESFSSAISPGPRSPSGSDFSEEDRLFERIFLGLQQSCSLALDTIPEVQKSFVKSMKISIQQGDPEQLKQHWQVLIGKCDVVAQNADILKQRLSHIKLKEPGIRHESVFWELCNSFMTSYYHLVAKVKEIKPMTSLLASDVVTMLRPLQKIVRETGQTWHASPWSYVSTPTHSNGLQTPISPMPLPMTPASAALGPAVQATVPSTPQTGSHNAMFSANFFERADHLLSMTNGAHTRTGTMTSSFGSGDGTTTPGSIFSPGSSTIRRFNGSNGKVII